jgi:hypothetical protein
MNVTKISIRGLTPILMHNGRLADPINPFTLALAKLTSKKSKTLADHKAIAESEWMGGLYTDENARPCLPGEVIESCLVEGAKKQKLGKVAKAAIVVFGDFPLEYQGPKTVEALYADGGFSKRMAVRVGQARVIRTRPMFTKWGCTFDVQWDDTMIKDEDSLIEIVHSAGLSGIGDYRPKFGRFEVVS